MRSQFGDCRFLDKPSIAVSWLSVGCIGRQTEQSVAFFAALLDPKLSSSGMPWQKQRWSEVMPTYTSTLPHRGTQLAKETWGGSSRSRAIVTHDRLLHSFRALKAQRLSTPDLSALRLGSLLGYFKGIYKGFNRVSIRVLMASSQTPKSAKRLMASSRETSCC